MLKISAILLGAGQSKRMGVDKLSLPLGRETVLEHGFKVLSRSTVEELVIVLSSRNKRLKDRFQRKKVKIVINSHPEKGMSSSIRRGLEALRVRSDGILIVLGDQPFLKTRTINALIRAFEREGKKIIVPSYQGRWGHPVIFHRKYEKELRLLKGDVGGRSLIQRHLEEVKVVPVKSRGVVIDIDTWQDYRKSREMIQEEDGDEKENFVRV